MLNHSSMVGEMNNTVLNMISGSGWINTAAIANVTFNNITFKTGNGSINYNQTFEINESFSIDTTNLDITQNRAFLDGTSVTFLNISAFITLYLSGLGFTRRKRR